MVLSRNKLYSILIIACAAGYIWVCFNMLNNQSVLEPVEVCFIKHFTNIPCPSCGSTRAILSLTKGNFNDAVRINPMGLLVAFIMLFSPLWILLDVVAKKNTLFTFYQKIDTYLKRPKIAIPLIIIVIINWIWNINKGL